MLRNASLSLFIIETEAIKMKCEKKKSLTTALKGCYDPRKKKVTELWKEKMAFPRKTTNIPPPVPLFQRPPPSSKFYVQFIICFICLYYLELYEISCCIIKLLQGWMENYPCRHYGTKAEKIKNPDFFFFCQYLL